MPRAVTSEPLPHPAPPSRSLATTGLFVLALFFALYVARAFVLPLAFAVLLHFLFRPVVRALERLRLPSALGAFLVIAALLAALVLAGYQLAEPAQRWARAAPENVRVAAAKIRKLRKPVEQVTRTAEQMAQATSVAPSSGTQVVVEGPSFVSRLFGTTQSVLVGAIEMLVLLYFLLAAGDLFLLKLVTVLPRFTDKKKAVSIARETEASVSRYLFTTALLNAGEGVAVGLAMWALGMPNPVLWGVLAFVLEFIPYVGAAAMTAILALAALATFTGVAHALLVPAVFVAINLIQANVVNPVAMGHRLTLNPVALFVGLLFWLWLWGVAGAFIAVPLMATFKIVCDHVESLRPIGAFLGR